MDAYAPGSSYAHPDRVIAPFPTGPTGVGGPHINVNSDGWLFVIFPNHFEAYGSNANGAPAPIRSATFYRAVGNAVAGAIGP